MLPEYPLQIIADPRFQMIITRAMNRCRVAPASPLPQPVIQSVRSSWSSASAVSTIDLKSPEPDIKYELIEKLEKIEKKSNNRKLLIGFGILFISLICIGIVLSIVLPITLIHNSPSNNSSVTESVTNSSKKFEWQKKK